MAPEVYRPGLFDTFLLDHDNVCHGNLVWVFHRNDHPNGEKYVIEAALTLLPEVNAAWQHISTLGQVFLTTEEVIKLGKDPNMTVRADGQPDRHIGLVNGFHEIHCLNMLRQNLHRDYYWPDGVESPYQWIHVYHYLYIILQSLTCDVNTDIATYNWVETRPEPLWDFSVNRVCRDFDALLEGHNRTTRPIDDYSFHRIGGEKEPAPEQLKAVSSAWARPRVGIKTDPALLASFEA